MKTVAPCDSSSKLVVEKRMFPHVRCVVFSVLAIVAPASNAVDEMLELRTGRRLEEVLEESTSISVTGAELRPLLSQIQRDQGIAIVLDRRIDPHSPLTTKTGFAPRLQVLKSVLPPTLEMDAVASDRFVLIGPVTATRRLPVLLDWHSELIQDISRAVPAADRVRARADLTAEFTALSEPRQILSDAANEAGLSLRNPQDIPHDVWPELHWPDMPFAELSTLILIQFDLALQGGATSGELSVIPIEELPPYEHRYAVGRKLKAEAQSILITEVDASACRWSGGTAIVTATLDQHARLLDKLTVLQSPDSKSATPGWIPITQRTFTLRIERATVGALVNSFRTQNIPIEIADEKSAEVAKSLQQRVQIDVSSEPASTFFQLAFGDAFQSVTVLDDRVILAEPSTR